MIRNFLISTVLALGSLTWSSFSYGLHVNSPHLGSTVKSYRAWKIGIVHTWEQRSVALKKRLQVASQNRATNSEEVHNLQSELKHNLWGINVAHHLTVRDYVALYVVSSPSPNRFHQAARGLAPQEVAELIQAYSESLHENHRAQTPSFAAAPSAEIQINP